MAFPKPTDKSKEYSVRRVVKQGQYYICGMCGSRFVGEFQAEACLKVCIKRYMQQSAVQDKPEKAGKVYRCAYCKRVYETMIQAKECARTCKAEIQKRIDAEARYKKTQSVEEKRKTLAAFAGGEQNLPPVKSAGQAEASAEARAAAKKSSAANSSTPGGTAPQAPVELPPMEPRSEVAPKPVHPAEGTKFRTDGNSYRCHTCNQKYKKYQDAILCYDRHRDQELAGVAMKKPGDDKFFRDGAHYVCKKCNSKWLSRAEVITCFDGHKGEGEDWMTGIPQAPKAKAAAAPAPASKESSGQSRTRRVTARSDDEKYFRDGAKYVCRLCNKKHFTKSDVIQCYDRHVAEEAGEADSGPTLTPQDIEAVAAVNAMQSVKIGSNQDGEDKFTRDGAKYVCKKCKSKWFTRSEVIQCFDKH